MKKFIIITSIFNPTKAVKEFSKLKGYNLIVVGDKKTPHNWSFNNVTYLSLEDQLSLDLELPSILPYNHYCRKMVGYLHAINNNAEIIIDTDDDNIPYKDWSFPELEGSFNFISNKNDFVNIYKNFTNQNIWPRGFPLSKLNYKKVNQNKSKSSFKIGIWQALANGDPDVDAIYRLTTNNAPCIFFENEPLVLDNYTFCPFNSQNTLFIKKLFPLLYLPTYVTFRFTDILRGLVAQPIMWEFGYNLGFLKATVTQERNIHDYFKDFESEIPMYLNIEKVVELSLKTVSKKLNISDNLFNIYESLHMHNIVEKNELKTLEYWLKDINSIKVS